MQLQGSKMSTRAIPLMLVKAVHGVLLMKQKHDAVTTHLRAHMQLLHSWRSKVCYSENQQTAWMASYLGQDGGSSNGLVARVSFDNTVCLHRQAWGHLIAIHQCKICRDFAQCLLHALWK
jgi:hypothetical protein